MTPILETIISLVFIFLVFSLITSWLVEFWSARFQRRGKMLRQFVVDSLSDKFNKNWGLLVYAHPLIDVLHQDIRLPKGFSNLLYNTRLNYKRRLPAYIPSDQFASALVDVVIQHHKTSVFEKDEKTQKYKLLEEEKLKDKILKNKRTFDEFIEGIDAMQESEVKITLTALARKVNIKEDSNELHSQIANWYNNGMDRLNGRYKKKVRGSLFMVGLLVAICFNVNTLSLVNRLYADPQLRTAVTEVAQKYINENKQLPNTTTSENINHLKNKVDSLAATLQPLKLPIGWPDETISIQSLFSKDAVNSVRNRVSLFNFLGWFVTALALSFGAPFWFDLLKKAVNMRSTGIRPSATIATHISR
jgi:hypothetical protein